MYHAAGHVEGLGPVIEAFLLDDNLMASWINGDRRWCVADKRSVDFDVSTGWSGVDIQRNLGGSGCNE